VDLERRHRISHSEVIRARVDQALTISPCHMSHLYQGKDPSAGGDCNSPPRRPGLITRTDSAC
jgi:endo-1,4-beta-xylanase